MTNHEITIDDLLGEMAAQEPHYGDPESQPDLRQLAKMLQRLSVDSICGKTGITPLIWTIENDSPLFNFLLVRAPDVNLRGTGEYDIAPIDLAISKGLMEKAETLARWGAPCPPEIEARWEAEKRAQQMYSAEIKKTEQRLEKQLKSADFQSEVRRLEIALGITAKKIRGRRGHLSFRDVPIRQLAKQAEMDEEHWLALQHSAARNNGVGLFSTLPVGAAAKLELCIVPTTEKRELVSISSLLTDQGALAYERMSKADVLDAINQDSPFHILTCGKMGIVGQLLAPWPDLTEFAERLFSICPELCADYEIRFDSERGNTTTDAPDLASDLVPLLVDDMAPSGTFWLPWGVDY